MPKDLQDSHDIMNVALALQGGGSLGAMQAGMLIALVLDPRIRVRYATGVSAGAMNGAVLTQIFNRYGQGFDGKQRAAEALEKMWLEDIALSDHAANTLDLFSASIDFATSVNPFLRHQMTSLNTFGLDTAIKKLVFDQDALQSTKETTLFIEAVNETNSCGRLFFCKQLDANALHASASLKGYIHPAVIDGKIYVDGAYLYGSNPPLDPLVPYLDELDAVICLMNTPRPAQQLAALRQSELTPNDIGSEGLILAESYRHIDWLRERYQTPILEISSHRAFTRAEKGPQARRVLEDRIAMGKQIASGLSLPKRAAA